MISVCGYSSPLGDMLLAADEEGLIGAWFEGQKYYASTLPPDVSNRFCPILSSAVAWLDVYFAGVAPNFLPPLHLKGTPFRRAVWELLLTVPYGQTTTYGALAQKLSESGNNTMSFQAVGGAVGRNPISILIPCHRVIGADGSLTGYAAGLDKKLRLLKLEGVDVSRLSLPEQPF